MSIPKSHIGEIIRTKYLQGWEQTYKDQTFESTRCITIYYTYSWFLVEVFQIAVSQLLSDPHKG